MFRKSSSCFRIRTHFDIFSIPLSTVVASRTPIDTHQLQKKLHALQRRFHPDSLVSKNDQERERCEEIASMVNSAYTVLRDDYPRHRYIAYVTALFKNPGGHELIVQNDKANPDDKRDAEEGDDFARLDRVKVVLDEGSEVKLGEELETDFLEEMMDLHEEIEIDGVDKERLEEMILYMKRMEREAREQCEDSLLAHGGEFFVAKVENYVSCDLPSGQLPSRAAEIARSDYIKGVMKWTYADNLEKKLLELR